MFIARHVDACFCELTNETLFGVWILGMQMWTVYILEIRFIKETPLWSWFDLYQLAFHLNLVIYQFTGKKALQPLS